MIKRPEITHPDEPVTLRIAAERYECKKGSLRCNIKAGKLAATKEGSRGVYHLKPTDVERFLEATPGITSIFNPKNAPAKNTGTEEAAPTAKEPSEAAENVTTTPPPSTAKNRPHEKRPVQTANTNDDGKDKPTRRRRNRRRRRGGAGGSSPSGVDHNQILKALDGATEKERLKIIACLRELIAIVAST